MSRPNELGAARRIAAKRGAQVLAGPPTLLRQVVPAQGTCPAAPFKLQFTEKDSAQALLEAKISNGLHGNKRRNEQRRYDCPNCEFWHLTSGPAR